MKMYLPTEEQAELSISIQQAEEAARSSDYEKALERYGAALQLLQGPGSGRADQEAAIRNARAALSIQLGQWTQAMEDVDKVLAAHATLQDQGQAVRARIFSAQVTSYQGEYSEAVSTLEQTLELAREHAGPLEQALVLTELGTVYARIGEHQPGRQSLEEACRILERAQMDAESAAVLANAYMQLGLAAYRDRRADDARGQYWKSLKLLRKHTMGTRIEADTYRYLGVLAGGQGTHTEALHYYQQALKQYHQLRLRLGEAKTYNSIGQTCMDLSRLEEALYFMKKAQTMCRELGADAEMATIYGKLGTIYMQRHEFDKAVENHLKDVEMCRRFGNYRALAFAIRNLGLSYRAKGELQEAEHYLKECLSRFDELQDRLHVARVHLDLAQVAIDRNQLSEAELTIESARTVFSERHAGPDMAYLYTLLGKVARLRQQWPQAQKHYEAALEVLSDQEPSARLADVQLELGQLYTETSNHEKAVEHLKESLRLARELGLRNLMATATPLLEKLDELELVNLLVEEVAAERPAPA